MKTPEEKIQYKNHFFKLGQGRIIPVSDEKFWLVFWNTPRELADILDLITSYDLHTVRDQNIPNFLLLVYVLAQEIVYFADNFSPRKHLELLNCLRLLAKVTPFVLECPNYEDEIEPRLFWSKGFNPLHFLSGAGLTLDLAQSEDPEGPILGAKLATSLVKLLFTPDFTVEDKDTDGRITFWEPGIGFSGKYSAPNAIYDSNRVEVLRTLVALISGTFYDKPSEVISKGSRFLTFLVTCLPKSELLSLVCSLFNLTCRSARKPEESGLVYENTLLSELRHLCVSYSAQLLTAMLVYPIPSLSTTHFLHDNHLTNVAKPLNMVRIFFGKLCKDSELIFMASHLLNIIRTPLSSMDEKSNSKVVPSPWALEATVIMWELLQCNKHFRSTLSDRLVLKLAPYLLYNVFAFFDNPGCSNLVKMSSYFLFYLSTEDCWTQALISPMSEQVMESFPLEFRLSSLVSIRDFMIIQICTILGVIAPAGEIKISTHLQTFLMPTLVDILYNIIPVVNENVQGTNEPARRMGNENPKGGLSYHACIAVTQLLAKFSTKSFLLDSPRSSEMLALIMRSLCSAATKQPEASRMLLFTFLKNEKSYDSVWNVIYSLGNEYFYGENMKLMNVQETDENDENDEEEEQQSPLTGIPTRSSMTSPDQQSLNSTTTNEDHFPGFRDSINNSLNNSLVSVLPEEDSEEEEEDEEKTLDDALRPSPPTGMSLKAKEKLPQEASLSRAWGGNDALRIIITILIPHMKLLLKDLWTNKEESGHDNFSIVRQIELSNMLEIINLNHNQINYDFLPNTPFDKLLFQWSHLSLGWYVSTLYWNIHNGPESIRKYVRNNTSLMANITSSIAVLSRFASTWSGIGGNAPAKPQDQIIIDYVERGLCTVNIWEGTNVKLFKIKPNENDKIFNAFGLKFGNANSGNGGINEITNSLARRFSDFRTNSRSNTTVNSVYLTPEDAESRPSKRNSVSSLHSLNALNRTRSNTPRNSFSI